MFVRRQLSLISGVYRRAGLGGLARFSASVRDYFREPVVMRSSPLFLQIEPTILCNLECSYCINPFLARERTSLTLEKFRRILDEVPSVSKISLVGIGETFMNKDVF